MTWQMHDTQWCNVKMCASCSFLLDGRFIKQEKCQCRGDSAQSVGSTEGKKTIKIDFKNICYVGTYSGSTRMFLVVASSVDPEPQDNSRCMGPQLVCSPIFYSKHSSCGVRLCCSKISCQVLPASKDGNSAASLGSLHYCLAVMEKFLLSSFNWCSLFLPFPFCIVMRSLILAYQPSVGSGGPARCLKAIPCQQWTIPVPPAFPHG